MPPIAETDVAEYRKQSADLDASRKKKKVNPVGPLTQEAIVQANKVLRELSDAHSLKKKGTGSKVARKGALKPKAKASISSVWLDSNPPPQLPAFQDF